MANIKKFNDGSTIEWFSKEGLKYTENGYSVLIWVDFEPGFFKSGRVIKSSSLERWDTVPDGSLEVIDERKKNEIIQKVKEYYGSKSCRVE